MSYLKAVYVTLRPHRALPIRCGKCGWATLLSCFLFFSNVLTFYVSSLSLSLFESLTLALSLSLTRTRSHSDCGSPSSFPSITTRVHLRYIGVLLSICASISSNMGVNMQKFSMTKEAAGRGEDRAYICQPLWGIGLVLVIAGSIGDLVALGYAAQSLAVPVGALTMVFNVLFAHFWLGEDLSRKDMMATFMVMSGVVLTAAFGDKSAQCFTMDDLMALYTEPTFLGYVAFVLPLMMTLYFLAHRADDVLKKWGPSSKQYKAWRKIHPLLYPVLSGFWGAQSVLFAKSIAEMVKLTARGYNQFTYVSIIIAVCMVVTIFTQIHFLAQGLQNFDAIFVVPVFQSAFIVGSILVGATYFKEFSNFSLYQVVFFPTGICIVIGGVMLLAQRKMSSLADNSEKGAEQAQMLFVRRKEMLDETPGVVQLFRGIRGRFGGKNSRRWTTGQEIPRDEASIKNSQDMALETLDEEDMELVELEQATHQKLSSTTADYVHN